MIRFDKVEKFILSDISIYIPGGVSVGLIGATGSGKTTFIKLACGLLQPEEGSVRTMGKNPIAELGKAGNALGVLFANLPILHAEESVRSNFQNLSLIYRLSEKDYEREYERLSEELGFQKFANEKVQNLSLGQRRRAELGAVLIHRPKLLLLDEPTIGLDQQGKDAIRRILRDREKEGLTSVVTSHDMADISEVCSRICCLDKGRLCYYGSRELLMKKYAPVDVMSLKLRDRIPDLEDLPIMNYSIDNNQWKITYNSNHITSAEILKVILAKCSVEEVSIRKSDLADIIVRMGRGTEDE